MFIESQKRRRKSKRYAATTKPVGINCSSMTVRVVGSIKPFPGGRKCRGMMNRITLSRLEEGLGHEGFQCSVCGRRVKMVPK